MSLADDLFSQAMADRVHLRGEMMRSEAEVTKIECAQNLAAMLMVQRLDGHLDAITYAGYMDEVNKLIGPPEALTDPLT